MTLQYERDKQEGITSLRGRRSKEKEKGSSSAKREVRGESVPATQARVLHNRSYYKRNFVFIDAQTKTQN